MIIEEIIEIKNKQYRHVYSNENKYILQKETGTIYHDAIDLINSSFSYEETDIPFEEE
ncbi:MAG: hypothetical protein IJX26_04085 [Clostridia bacterium]|nr:hypothetical protein [Clostridia bacterium]